MKLFRYEYWRAESGINVEYLWAKSTDEVAQVYDGTDKQTYRIIQATKTETEAWENGFEEGQDVGVMKERIASDNGVRYQYNLVNEDFTAKFICGDCKKEFDAGLKSINPITKTYNCVAVGEYGTMWSLCTDCYAKRA